MKTRKIIFMKRVFIILSAIILLCAFTFVALKYYTKEKIDLMINKAVNSVVHNNFEPLNFGNILYLNVHTFIDTLTPYTFTSYYSGKDTTILLNQSHAGIHTPKYYKNGLRKDVANNPQLIYLALDLFKSMDGVRKFEECLLTKRDNELKEGYSTTSTTPSPAELEKEDPNWWKPSYFDRIPKDSLPSYKERRYQNQQEGYLEAVQDSIAWVKRMNDFSIENFWKEQRAIITKYDNLIEHLLELPESTLNEYIKEVGWEQEYCDCSNGRSAKKTQAWMLQNNLINKIPTTNYNYGQYENEQVWYLMMYPVDFLLFVYRISNDYPEWTPREIVKEAQKFSKTLKEIIP